jgi:phosphoserine phosphatase RsbU/P
MSLVRFKRAGRRLKRLRRHMTVARTVILAECLIYSGVFLFVMTARLAALAGWFSRHADLVVAASAIALFIFLHFVVARRITALIERYLAPPAYDERRILFDLGQESRSATDIDDLYKSIVSRIGDALGSENVSIFVRDDASGNYVCRICEPQIMLPEALDLRDEYTPVEGARLVFTRDAFVVKRLHHLGTLLVIEPEDFETWARAFASARPALREARERERATLRQASSNLLVPIKSKDQLIGILSLGPRRSQHKYSAADKEMLISVASQLALVIENSKLIERIVAEERLRRELALAAEVQRRLFPVRPPASASIELSGFCQPARGVGGDYYDFLELSDEQIGIAVADVAGKGISAALLMSSVQASLRSHEMMQSVSAQPTGSPAELVSTVNRLLCRSTGAATYVTFFYAQFDQHNGELTYVNAGHNPPMLLRSSSKSGKDARPALTTDTDLEIALHNGNGCYSLTTGGTVIGLFQNLVYDQETIQLERGDLLIAYTDGVTEALNEGGEEFGEQRLQAVVDGAAHLSASEVRDTVVKRVQVWCANTPQHDDLTFIVLKMR